MQDTLNILLPETSDSDFIEHHGVIGMKWGVRRYEKELAWKKRNSSMANIAADKRTGKISKEEAKRRRQITKANLKTELKQSKDKVKSIKDKGELTNLYNQRKEEATRAIPYNRLKKAARVIANTSAGFSAFHAAAAGTTLAAIGAATANPVLLGVGLADVAISTPMTVITNRIQRGIQKRMYY